MVPSALTTEVGAGTTVWPDSPYKGLNYYSTEDAGLFTGRDKDVENARPFWPSGRHGFCCSTAARGAGNRLFCGPVSSRFSKTRCAASSS